jgi:hypothetical protein
LTRIAAHVACTSMGLSQGARFRIRVDRRLPALSSERGQKPAREIRCPAILRRDMLVPISATTAAETAWR